MPLADAREAAERVPKAKLVTLDADHWPVRERAEESNEIVIDFLESDRVT